MLMNSSKLVFPLSSWLNPVTIFALSTLFCITIVSCSSEADQKLYNDHCGSIVPRATAKDHDFYTIPFLYNQEGYYMGGDEFDAHQESSEQIYPLRNRKLFWLRTEEVHYTDADDIYRVKATLIFETEEYVTYDDGDVQYTSTQQGSHEFELQGFWATSSGKLCVVGSTIATSSQGQKKTQSSDVVLKLSDAKESSNITNLITGTLESLSPADGSTYFKPISLLIFPMSGYKYTKVSKDFNHGCPGQVDVPKSASLSLTVQNPICSVVRNLYNSLELEYESECGSSNSCNQPFGEALGYLPQYMFLRSIQCSEDQQSLRFLVEFSNYTYIHYSSFAPNLTMVAEGSWDAKKNQLCGVACKMSNTANSFDGVSIGDCSTRLSLRFPATWSVKSTSAIVGNIWTNKKANDSGYFDRITFTGSQSYNLPGLKYNYSLVERAAQECQMKKPIGKKGMQYSGGNGYEMQFSMSPKTSQGKGNWWGNSNPVFVGDQPWNRNSMSMSITRVRNSSVKAKTVPNKPVNISYQLSFSYYNENSTTTNETKITAEGIYDPATGNMCMVGCKYLEPHVQALARESMDCKILVTVQFPPTKSNKHIEVQIESTRDKSSSLYFKTLLFSGVPYYSHGETMWRMDSEIIMALITNTLACIFVGSQILYLKKHHNVVPSISLVMLVILTLGQMIPLMLNFEALFFSRQNHYGGYGWVEVNEVFIRVITMVAFLLHFRLLQVAFSARVGSENQKISWNAEKKTLYWALPLYIAGGLIGFLVNWKKYRFGEEMYSRRRRFYLNNHRSFWQDSRSYSGLILDVFLFPQILLNIFLNSRGKVLSEIFYLGTTLVRLVPHAYDLYRARHFVQDYRWSYMYAAPGADFYSTAWDVIILLVGMLFASLIFLQQRFGGRSFLPKWLKAIGEYEKVPVTIDA